MLAVYPWGNYLDFWVSILPSVKWVSNLQLLGLLGRLNKAIWVKWLAECLTYSYFLFTFCFWLMTLLVDGDLASKLQSDFSFLLSWSFMIIGKELLNSSFAYPWTPVFFFLVQSTDQQLFITHIPCAMHYAELQIRVNKTGFLSVELEPVHKSQLCASFPNTVFTGIILVDWIRRWEYLCHINW